MHHLAQGFARLIDQSQPGFYRWPRRIADLRQIKAQHAFGATYHLFTRHLAAIAVQPATPESGNLIVQMPSLGMVTITQHEIGFQCIVGVLYLGRRCILIKFVGACTHTVCRGRGRIAVRLMRLTCA
ncbi:hypothetical protein GALL_507960 [mine drainage metagenome]|uniref:Uncharacterized protein n=1 Tax=mine drainage metagenome TaxID=410659 RepID=A0A1J5PA58_9ZZZZ